MNPAVQWGFMEAGKSHRIPGAVAPPSAYGYYGPAPTALPPLSSYGYSSPYYDPYAQSRVLQRVDSRFQSDPVIQMIAQARTTAELVHAAEMIERTEVRPGTEPRAAAMAPPEAVPTAPPPQAPPPPPAAQPPSGDGLAGMPAADSQHARLQERYVVLLEEKVKALEAQLAAVSSTLTPETTASPKRAIERKPQTAPKLHSSAPKPAAAAEEESYADADSTKWDFPEVRYGGAYSYASMGQKEQVKEPIAAGVAKFKAAPHKYAALWYQANMVDWCAACRPALLSTSASVHQLRRSPRRRRPAGQQKYTLLHRKGTKGFTPQNTSEQGAFACVTAKYKRLPPLDDLGSSKDSFTDQFNYQGYTCAGAAKPGRGEGVGDVPSLKLWGDVDPSDISQVCHLPLTPSAPPLPLISERHLAGRCGRLLATLGHLLPRRVRRVAIGASNPGRAQSRPRRLSAAHR
jgi:hypothetical protein